MKKLLLLSVTGCTLLLAGCFETTQEITLNEDGSGTYVNTSDMSKIIPIVKNMGIGGNDKIPVGGIDTSFSLFSEAGGNTNISPEDEELLKKGSMHLQMSMENEKFITITSFHFSAMTEIPRFNHLAGKAMSESIKNQMPEGIPTGGDGVPESSSFDDYYITEFSNGELKRKLDKEKYAKAESDEFLMGLKQAGDMGIPITYTYIINLPRPAEKAEGKNLKLSNDKMKVTVTATIDDFFDNPSDLEFKVKY